MKGKIFAERHEFLAIGFEYFPDFGFLGRRMIKDEAFVFFVDVIKGNEFVVVG